MTPKLKLSEHARKMLLSWIRKFDLPGMRRTKASTQMMDAPKTQASGSSKSVKLLDRGIDERL